MPPLILPLHSRDALRAELSGGKASRLAALLREDMPVPSGFIIATCLHDRLLHSQRPRLPLSSSSDFAARLPSEDRENIVNTFRRLGGPVSVRSSMIGEDSANRSFAGQLRTVLNVTGENDLLEAIGQCYASAERFSWRHDGDSFSKERVSPSGMLAILVQRMVPAKAAGVAFSADPNTGKRCIIIEATFGLGDKLVSGHVVPDRYIIDPHGIIASQVVSSHRAPVLQPEQILQLASLADQVHRHMGSPQDIEWAWDGSHFWILQSRPITSLYGRHLFSNQLVSDMTPGLMKPLLWSTNIADMMENVFIRIFRELLGGEQLDRTSLVRCFHSRIYADMSQFGQLLERLGLPGNFFEMVTHDEVSHSGHPRWTFRLIQSLPRMLLFIARYGRIRRQARLFVERHEKRLKRFRRQDWSLWRPEELLDQSQALRNDHGQTQWHMWITAMNMMVRKKLLSRFLQRHVPDVTTHQLLSGLVGLKSLEPNHHLKQMAALAKKLTSADQKVLLDGDDRSIRSRLSRTPSGRELLSDFDDFMRRYGFLSSSGTDFTVSPWSEHPGLIWKGIGRLMDSATDGAESDAAITRERSLHHVRSRLRFPQTWLFPRLLRSTQEYVKLRERISLFMSEDVYHMRRIYHAIGDQLVMDGQLEQREDIFYLSFQELASFIDGSAARDLLKKNISDRKTVLEADAAIEPEDVFYGEPRHWRPPSGHMPGPYLQGISGSLGLTQGYARIVNDPVDIEIPLTKRDILVVPHTDVGWTPLFPSIGGIVAETGGQLSHSAIIAREYGLPAVVSVKKATRIIQNGQPITLDGDNGRVYLKHILAEKEPVK